MPRVQAGKASGKKDAVVERSSLADKRRVSRQTALYLLLFFALLVFSSTVGAAFYLSYLQEQNKVATTGCVDIEKIMDNTDEKFSKLEEKIDKISALAENENKDKLLLRAADKYHLVLFANQIIEKIKLNTSYASSLKELEPFASGTFDTELQVLQESRESAEILNEKIIEELKKTLKSTVISGTQTSTSLTWLEKLRTYFVNAFKLKKVEDVSKNLKSTQHIVNDAIGKINAGDNEGAISALSSLNVKELPEDLRPTYLSVVMTLEARARAHNAAKKIMSDNLPL